MSKLPKTVFVTWETGSGQDQPWLATAESAEELASGCVGDVKQVGIYQLESVMQVRTVIEVTPTTKK